MTDTLQAGVFEILGISGVSMARGEEVMGIRMAYPHPSLGLFDDKDVLLTLDAPDKSAPDLSYVKYSWRVPISESGFKRYTNRPRKGLNAPVVFDFAPGEAARITLEWFFDGEIVSGKYTADAPVRVGLFVNGCFREASVIAADETFCRLKQGDSHLELRLHGDTRAPFLIDTRKQAEQVFDRVEGICGTAMALFTVELAPDKPLHFSMRMPKTPVATMLALDTAAIDAALSQGAHDYAASRMRSEGLFADSAQAVAALAGYSRTYDPQRKMLQTTVNRTWGGVNSPGLIFGWDNFFDSYIAAWEDPPLGAASLEHVVTTYGEHGIANGPTQRNLIIPLIYCRTLDIIGDEALAHRTWPTMMAFMRFWFADRGDGIPWRDGNRDGLIESGTCFDPKEHLPGHMISEAMDETGYDEIPIYSAGFCEGRLGMTGNGVEFDKESQCLTISLVCQNSLYCAACKAMAMKADQLGHDRDAQWLRGEAERVAARMKERLFNSASGIFNDRRWDDSFSSVLTPTTFYPLLAGITDGNSEARLKEILLDPHKFWGDNLVPTVSRDDPAYCDGLDKRGNYWRGNVWPPTTYIVYLAIKEAGWDEIAAEYARKVNDLFMDYWRAHGHAYENYPAEGKIDHNFLYVSNWGGREVRYVWSAMMPLCGLEEIFSPEMTRSGLRFGNPHLAQAATWERFRFAGHLVKAQCGPEMTHVQYGDQWTFLAKPGVVVREFVHQPAGTSFTVKAEQPAQIDFRTVAPVSGVQIDGADVKSRVEDSRVVFHVPAGKSMVSLGHRQI